MNTLIKNTNDLDDIIDVPNSTIIFSKCADNVLTSFCYRRGIPLIRYKEGQESEIPKTLELLWENGLKYPNKAVVSIVGSVIGSVIGSVDSVDSVDSTDPTDNSKFQKTMQKEAKKLLHAESREKYKQKMRQSSSLKSVHSSLSGKKSHKNTKK